MAVATYEDVGTTLGRTISDLTEQAQVEWWLTGVEMLIRVRLGDITLLDEDVLVYVEAEAVAAKVRRHGTTESSVTVSVNDGSVTRRFDSPVGTADMTDEWWNLLDPDADTGSASIRPYFEPDAVQWPVRTPGWCDPALDPELGNAVTLASAIGAELPFLRSEAEALMLDTFAAYSPTGRTVVNGVEVEAYADEGTVQGKVAGSSAQSRDTSVRTVTVADVERPVVEGGLHISVSAAMPTAGPFGIGWEYQLTALGPSTDPSLLNSRWLVVDAPAKSYATARRLDVVRLDA